MLDIIVNKFEFQLHYYSHFWTNTPENSMKPFIPHSFELNSLTTVFLEG